VVVAGFLNVAWAGGLATMTVAQSNQAPMLVLEGVIEAVKTSQIAPQVSGGITALPVKAGDSVKAGQFLVRIDTRMATQQSMTNNAQVAAAKAQLSAARQEYERKRRLYDKQYISQAAMERAESDYKTAEAQTNAQLAQTGLSNVQAGLHTINAPYAGLVAEVLAELGDMAMPGKPLITIYDPKALRVVVNVPQSQVAKIKQEASIKVLISGANEPEQSLTGTQITVLPTADSVSNMVKMRVTLPQNLTSIKPGMFARAIVPVTDVVTQGYLYVPIKAVIKRSELMAVYVVNNEGQPQLRQVRLGREQGENVEVFAGLQAGEKVALDPIAASKLK
jgi:RND family efflux transporter MFP subunit